MTQEYDVQRPSSVGLLPHDNDLVLKWTHSVVCEPDFCSEWDAAHRASELALQCSFPTFCLPNSPGCIRKKRVGLASVSFDPWVDVCIGDDNEFELFQVTVHADALCSHVKPWSNRRVFDPLHVITESFDYSRDLSVDVSCLFDSFMQDHSQTQLATCSDPLSLCEAVLIPSLPSSDFLDPFSQVFMQKCAAQIGKDQFHGSSIDQTNGVSELCASDGQFCNDVVEPLREVAVLSPSCCDVSTFPAVHSACSSCGLDQHHCHSIGSVLCCAPMQHPGSNPADQGPDVNMHQPLESSTTASGSAASEPIRLPPFAQQMMVNLPIEFLHNPTRIVQGVLARTWYLHHVNIPRSLQSRQVMLTGPPHLWRGQILALWSDIMIPGEDLTLDLVNPAPPRNWHETNILFDLILAQGLYISRFSGLVSISPTITEPSLRMYAIAVSFDSVISGQDVVTQSDLQPMCNRFDCLIFHARQQLYIDFNPVHRMTHGDSFVVYLSRRPDHSALSVAAAPVLSQDPAPEPANEPFVPSMPRSASNTGLDASQPRSHDSNPNPHPTDDSERRRVTLYRLDRPSVSVWIRWKQFSHLLQDVLDATNICPSNLAALHPLHAKPVGESPYELSVIVQHVGDIAPGSAESLILLDTIFHQQGAAVQSFVDTQVDRRVIKIPVPVTRQGILHFARVGHYCEHLHHACLVAVNHVLWPTQQGFPKALLHGTYGRIQIPPARTIGVETCRAVSLIEDVSDGSAPTFAQVYPQLPHHAENNRRHDVDGVNQPPNPLQDCIGQYPLSQPRRCHFADDHQVSGHVFESDIPAQVAPVFPNIPEWSQFQLEMWSIFEEHSTTDLPEEGPILHATTWYIHHDRTPTCIVGRLVRLSNRPAEWPSLLCAPWIHLLQPFENLAVRLVRPSPPSSIPGMHMFHVILEQGLQQSRMTVLFSAIFQGVHGDVTHRRAQSIPNELSQEVISRILDIQPLCRARRCAAWSGRVSFHRSRLERVFNGIGICITVNAFRNRFGLVDADGYPMHGAASSSDASVHMSFRVDDATLFPSAANAAAGLDDPVLEHAPSRLIPELKIIWDHYLITTEHPPYRFYVETWFCDHDRYPRTNRGREVLLHPDMDSWRDTLLAKWQDLIDPAAEVSFYVVAPQPFGGATEVLAHIILAQHQHRGFVSALITTLAPGDDPWDPPRVALKLPSVVDKAVLVQESGLFMFCPPFIPFNICNAFSGDQIVTQDVLRPAKSGDSFLCVAELPTTAPFDRNTAIDFERDIDHLFKSLGNIVVQLTHQVCVPKLTRSPTRSNVTKLKPNVTLSRLFPLMQLPSLTSFQPLYGRTSIVTS